MKQPKFDGKFFALVILLIIVLMAAFSCKDKIMTDRERELYQRQIDSVLIRNTIIDAENKLLKERGPIHDTVYIKINRKVKNEFHKVDNFDSVARVRWIEEFERANTLNK